MFVQHAGKMAEDGRGWDSPHMFKAPSKRRSSVSGDEERGQGGSMRICSAKGCKGASESRDRGARRGVWRWMDLGITGASLGNGMLRSDANDDIEVKTRHERRHRMEN